MTLTAATHSGPFHADDVLAWALIKVFHAPDGQLVRTRDPAQIRQAELVFDVGGQYDPKNGRFDHHQASYQGPLSSAGMVLEWLMERGEVELEVGAKLKAEMVDYVDAVDNGRLVPDRGVPCFARVVELYAAGHDTHEAFDAAYHRAVAMAEGAVRGVVSSIEEVRRARSTVVQAMKDAEQAGRNVIFLDGYQKWKPVYYAQGGAQHPTEYIVFPGIEGTWRVIAIAPHEDSFDQKRPLPESWAGLTGSSLSEVTGVQGSLFCHKNRFIAVFESRDAAVEALERHGLMWRERN